MSKEKESHKIWPLKVYSNLNCFSSTPATYMYNYDTRFVANQNLLKFRAKTVLAYNGH